MPWETDIIADIVDGETPPELLEVVEKVTGNDELRIESVCLARKKREKRGGKPSRSYLKFATYLAEAEVETAEDICAAVIGGAYACGEKDGELSCNNYQVTVVWTVRETGKKDRDRATFEIDASRRQPAHSPTNCSGCAAYRDLTQLLKSHVSTLTRDLTSARREASGERERADGIIKAERDKRDDLVRDLVKSGHDAAKEAREVAKDARDAYKPTQDSTAQILGMMGAALDTYKGAVDAQAKMAETMAEGKYKAAKSEMVKETLATVKKLGEKLIAAKFGSDKKKQTRDEKTDGPSEKASKTTTAMEELEQLRNTLFEKATQEEWGLMRHYAGDDFVDTIETMREGELDLDKLDKLCEDLAANVAPTTIMALMMGLSEPVQDVMMNIGDLVKAAIRQRDKETD